MYENVFSSTIVFQTRKLRSNHLPKSRQLCHTATEASDPGFGYKKKRSPYELLFCVPYDVLFSNEFLRDLGRIWSLRDIIPDPNNLPWIEKIE